MATYRAIAASEVDAGSPLTATLATAWTDNLTATMEQASGAPRYAEKVITGSAAAASSLTFSGFDAGGYSGAIIHGYFRSTTANARDLTLQIGDATTLASADTLITTSTGSAGAFTLSVDCDTGDWKLVHFFDSTVVNADSGTASLPAGAVTRIRINTDTDQSIAAFCIPNGGAA